MKYLLVASLVMLLTIGGLLCLQLYRVFITIKVGDRLKETEARLLQKHRLIKQINKIGDK